MDQIIQKIQSLSWWFDGFAQWLLPLFFFAVWRWLFGALKRMTWADVVLACHCTVAMALAVYIALNGDFPRPGLTGWEYWHAKATNIVAFGIFPTLGPIMLPPLSVKWPKKALALLYSAIAIVCFVGGLLDPKPLWIMAVGYCFLLMMVSTVTMVLGSLAPSDRSRPAINDTK
jgi:hypothetical protein